MRGTDRQAPGPAADGDARHGRASRAARQASQARRAPLVGAEPGHARTRRKETQLLVMRRTARNGSDDPVGEGIRRLIEDHGEWKGTAGELLHKIAPERPGKGWPRTSRGMTGRLKRMRPVLERVGIAVDQSRASTRQRTRLWTITRTDPGPTVLTGQSSEIGPGDPVGGDTLRTVADGTAARSPSGWIKTPTGIRARVWSRLPPTSGGTMTR